MDEAIQISCIIDKLSPFWKDFKHTLKHKKRELTLVDLSSYLRIEEPLRLQDNDKLKGNNIAGPSLVNMVEHNNSTRDWDCKAIVRLPNLKLKTLGERGIECVFVGYAKHSKAFRFFVIKLNDSGSIKLIIESRDAIFDENRFSSVTRISLSILNRTEDTDGLVVSKKVIEEVVAEQPELKLRKSKMNRTLKNIRPEFQFT
nr:zinc finger, CCHC-type [Tanacetum cinerariifolium]